MIRVLAMAAVLILSSQSVMANARVTVLMDVLRISDVIEIMRSEGFAYAEELNADMLNGQGGAFWRAQIDQIYAAHPIAERVRTALETDLTPEQVEAAIAFFGSSEGTRIIELENAARRAMSDPTVEESARMLFDEQMAASDPMAKMVMEFIAANDLLERNVTGAMSSNVQFYMGLSDGRFIEDSETQIIEDVWAQQEVIHKDTEDWLNGFLFMAYSSLPEDVMKDYVAFSRSLDGQALNAALFDGFEEVYREVSYSLGRAIALNADGDEI